MSLRSITRLLARQTNLDCKATSTAPIIRGQSGISSLTQRLRWWPESLRAARATLPLTTAKPSTTPVRARSSSPRGQTADDRRLLRQSSQPLARSPALRYMFSAEVHLRVRLTHSACAPSWRAVSFWQTSCSCSASVRTKSCFLGSAEPPFGLEGRCI